MDHLPCGTVDQCEEQSCINQFCFACGIAIEHLEGQEEVHHYQSDPPDDQLDEQESDDREEREDFHDEGR